MTHVMWPPEWRVPEWFNAVDRDRLDEALTAEPPLSEALITPCFIRTQYGSVLAAIEAIQRVFTVIVSILHDHRDEHDRAVLRLTGRDLLASLIAAAHPYIESPGPVRAFAARVRDEIEMDQAWRAFLAADPAVRTRSTKNHRKFEDWFRQQMADGRWTISTLADEVQKRAKDPSFNVSTVKRHRNGTQEPHPPLLAVYETIFDTRFDGVLQQERSFRHRPRKRATKTPPKRL